MEEVIVSCVIKHLTLVDALQSLVNYQYREEHGEEYDLVCKIMTETFKKINAVERQLQVRPRPIGLSGITTASLGHYSCRYCDKCS